MYIRVVQSSIQKKSFSFLSQTQHFIVCFFLNKIKYFNGTLKTFKFFKNSILLLFPIRYKSMLSMKFRAELKKK